MRSLPAALFRQNFPLVLPPSFSSVLILHFNDVSFLFLFVWSARIKSANLNAISLLFPRRSIASSDLLLNSLLLLIRLETSGPRIPSVALSTRSSSASAAIFLIHVLFLPARGAQDALCRIAAQFASAQVSTLFLSSRRFFLTDFN